MQALTRLWNSKKGGKATRLGTRGLAIITVCVAITALGCDLSSMPPTPTLFVFPTLAPTEQVALPTTPAEIVSTEAAVTFAPTEQPTDAVPTLGPEQPSTPSSVLRVYFVDVGQGDAILILSPDNKTILIDGGETDTGIVPFLQSMGVQQIDLIVATHPHSDHIGGLVQVLKAMPVARVVTNGQSTTTSTYEHFLDAIISAQAEYAEAKTGDTVSVGILNFNILNPTTLTDDTNHNSLVLRLMYGNVSFLFTGDADQAAEADMMSASLPLGAIILKVGHHGSRSSSSPAFLAQVKPQIAVYSAGAGNSYGHPRPETLAALAAVGTTVFGTDVNGTVVITTDGVQYHAATSR